VIVILFGSNGQLGASFKRHLSGLNDFKLHALTRSEIDLSNDRDAIAHRLELIIKGIDPDLIINAAAYTAVDRAEADIDQAFQVNAWFPGELAKLAAQTAARLIHFSSDYVFDGELIGRAYSETDDCYPQSAYGRSKLEGELAVLANSPKAWVIRTSWVVGTRGQNFAKTMLRLACEREVLRVVADQWGVPSPTSFLVESVVNALGLYTNDSQGGLYHLCPQGETNWHAYASWVIKRALAHPRWHDRLKLQHLESIQAISSEEYPTAAKRPKNSRLDCSLWTKTFEERPLAFWQDALAPTIDEILASD
jgi:dTDP-4-dehydrorhamnose reductase